MFVFIGMKEVSIFHLLNVLNRYRAPRHKQSFPTRRSSDLDNSNAYGPSQGRLRIDASYLTSTAMSTPGMAMYRDRKSTRLNSSHVRISYAVFCLKKKKRKNRRETKGSIFTMLLYVPLITIV